MRIAIGADHAGFKMKAKLEAWLRSPQGGSHQVRDVGTTSEESTDYPDYAAAVGRSVAAKKVSKGILLCGTGIGMSIAANKIKGVRAAVAWNPQVAALTAEHNGSNVVCIPARFVNTAKAQAILKAFLNTPFGGGRHLRRLKKIQELEK